MVVVHPHFGQLQHPNHFQKYIEYITVASNVVQHQSNKGLWQGTIANDSPTHSPEGAVVTNTELFASAQSNAPTKSCVYRITACPTYQASEPRLVSLCSAS